MNKIYAAAEQVMRAYKEIDPCIQSDVRALRDIWRALYRVQDRHEFEIIDAAGERAFQLLAISGFATKKEKGEVA